MSVGGLKSSWPGGSLSVGHSTIFWNSRCMNRNSGFALNTSRMQILVLVVVEMLVHAAVLDQHHVAGLPFHVAAVMNVVAVALEHVEHRAVEMAVLLAGIERRIAFDMRFDRLHDVDGLRRDDVLAVHRRPALPRMILRGIDPRLFEELLVKMAVGAFQRAHEGALLGPALPFAVLDLVGVFLGRLVMPEPGRFVFQHSGHVRDPLKLFRGRRLGRRLRDFSPARNVATAHRRHCSAGHLSRAVRNVTIARKVVEEGFA